MSRNEFICDCNAIHQEVVESTKKQMLNDEDLFNNLAEFFKILGDTTRVKAANKQKMVLPCHIFLFFHNIIISGRDRNRVNVATRRFLLG